MSLQAGDDRERYTLARCKFWLRALGKREPALQTLFDASSYALNPYHQEFEIAPDGHFLMLGVPKGAGQQVTRLVEVDNWFADLKARLAGQ